MLDLNRIYRGDCLELFKSVPDDCVDVTFADPPFNLSKKYTDYKDSKEVADYLDWCDQWLKEMVRITKPTGTILVHNIPKWLGYYTGLLNNKAYFKHWIAWDAPTAPMGKSLQPAHYGILYYTKTPTNKHYELRHPHKRCRTCEHLLKDYGGKKADLNKFGPLISDVWTDIHRIKHDKYKDKHPCQLPVHLLERLILMTTDEGDIVLDPFMGTGTTALAAHKLGRNFLGFELSDVYVDIGMNKVAKSPQTRIGDVWVSIFLNEVWTVRNIDCDRLLEYHDKPQLAKEIETFKVRLTKDVREQLVKSGVL